MGRWQAVQAKWVVRSLISFGFVGAVVTYDRMNTWEWVQATLLSVFVAVAAPYAVRKEMAGRRDRKQ